MSRRALVLVLLAAPAFASAASARAGMVGADPQRGVQTFLVSTL